MSESDDMKQDILPQEGRDVKPRKPYDVDASVKRRAYFKAVKDIKEDGQDFAIFHRCPLCGKEA